MDALETYALVAVLMILTQKCIFSFWAQSYGVLCTHTHTHTHTHVSIYLYLYLCVCVCVENAMTVVFEKLNVGEFLSLKDVCINVM